MKRTILQFLALIIIFLVIYLILISLGFEEKLTDALTGRAATVWTALLMFGLLASDVIMPVPSSLVMTANGALFGSILGALVSILGGIASSCLGYLIRRNEWVRSLIKVDPTETSDMGSLSSEFVAVILTRPIPLLAEAAAVLAGNRRMRFSVFASASLIGIFPATIIYAVVGSGIAQHQSTVLYVAIYMVFAGSAYAISTWWLRKRRPRLVK